ncbi:DUF6316 family protein [Marinobacter caseinilyticus]|uniref:DUF6316 family protein n=1 Tax=Marinobacter caseinilyticus TaxID=2692195 RepID=UPI0014074AFD|nr:DUF6316 family protein [Marinobacter caseinilyticus]
MVVASALYGLDDIKNRLIRRQGKWFVRTREIPEHGPFTNRLEAIEGLFRHVEICSGSLANRDRDEARAIAEHFINTCRLPDCPLCQQLALAEKCA